MGWEVLSTAPAVLSPQSVKAITDFIDDLIKQIPEELILAIDPKLLSRLSTETSPNLKPPVTPASQIPRPAVRARVRVLAGSQNAKEDEVMPVFVRKFPEIVQANMLQKHVHGDASVCGGMEREASIAWIICGKKLFLWNYLVPATNCTVLEIPPNVNVFEGSGNGNAGRSGENPWLLCVVNWNRTSRGMKKHCCPTGIVLCEKKTRAVVYWPEIYGEERAAPVCSVASSDDLQLVSPSPVDMKTTPFTSMIVSAVPNSSDSCVALTCSSNGELWKFYCRASSISCKKLYQTSLDSGYPRSLAWWHESSGQFLILTHHEMQCFSVELSPDQSLVSKLWTKEIPVKAVVNGLCSKGTTIVALIYRRAILFLADTRVTHIYDDEDRIGQETASKVFFLDVACCKGKVAVALCGYRYTRDSLKENLEKVAARPGMTLKGLAEAAHKFLHETFELRNKEEIYGRLGDCSVVIAGLDEKGNPSIFTIDTREKSKEPGLQETHVICGPVKDAIEGFLKAVANSKEKCAAMERENAVMWTEATMLLASVISNSTGNCIDSYHIDEESANKSSKSEGKSEGGWEHSHKSVLDLFQVYYDKGLFNSVEAQALYVLYPGPDLVNSDDIEYILSTSQGDDANVPSCIVLGWSSSNTFIRAVFDSPEKKQEAFKVLYTQLASIDGSTEKFQLGYLFLMKIQKLLVVCDLAGNADHLRTFLSIPVEEWVIDSQDSDKESADQE